MRPIASLSLLLFILAVPAFGEGKNSPKEISPIEEMIFSTEETLNVARTLKDKIQVYLDLQETFIINPSDKETCFQMVKAAHHIMADIQNYQLSQLFDPEFLSELSLFSEMGRKRPSAKMQSSS